MKVTALYDYQSLAVEWLSVRRAGMVKSPAGSGKTIIGAAAIHRVIGKRHRSKRVRVGWIANTNEQVDQARDALKMFTMNIESKVVCAAGNPDMSDRDILVIDECQHATAPQWKAIIDGCQGAKWFFSATPFGEDEERNATLREMCANEVFVISREQVAHKLAEARVTMLSDTDACGALISQEIESELHRSRYMLKVITEGELFARVASRICMEIGIAANQARNKAIIRTALEHREDSVLILVNKIEHGKELSSRIEGSQMCFSKMEAKKRRAAIAAFAAGQLWCLIATSLADEGLDVPRANILVMAGAGKSAGRTEQRTGRVLRAFKDKTHGTIYDFTDTQHAVLRNQSLKRVAVYKALGYQISSQNQPRGLDFEKAERILKQQQSITHP